MRMNILKYADVARKWLSVSAITFAVAALVVSTLALVPAIVQAMERDLYRDVTRSCKKLQHNETVFQPRYMKGPELIEISKNANMDTVFVNDAELNKLPPYVREFELYSACGRLNILNKAEPDQTIEADCWAVQSLIRIGRWSKTDVQRVIDWYFQQGARSETVSDMPVSSSRARSLYSCQR